MANGLPTNWIKNHGAYYYNVPRKLRDKFGCSWYRLGKTLSEAYREFSMIIDEDVQYKTMSHIMTRYMREISPNKAKATHKNELNQVTRLEIFFGEMPPHSIKPVHIHQYLDIRKNAPVAANREIALLSNMFSKAVRWGILEVNPCTGKKIEKHTEKPRDRYISDEEFSNFYHNYCSPFLQAYLKVKYITGQRQGDVLRIKLSDITSEGIYFFNKKTGKQFLMQISEELQLAINQAKAIKHKVGTIYLFATRSTGQPYKPTGFSSIWQRRMKKFVADGNTKFTEQDFRAKTASDTDIEHANEMMQHNSIAFTERVYRRKLKVVRPLK